MSRAQDSSSTLPISVYCRNCLDGYRTLCDGLGAVTPQQALDIGFDRGASHDFMLDARSRFKAWAVNIAALQGAHLQSSLDFRLKEAPGIRQRIVKILTALIESLHEALLIVDGTEPNEKWDVGAISDSDDDNASTPEEATQTSDLGQLFTAIKTANSSLMKLSMVIRNSPARDDYLKAASRYHFDARYDIGHVKEKHGAAKRSSDWLLERLGKAITRRRQYLKYREDHHIKLSKDWGEEAAAEVDMAGLEAPPMATAKAIEDEKPEKTIALTKLTKATTYVGNETMIERDGIDLDQGSFGSQTSYEPTVAGEAVHKLSVPPPPIMAFEGVPFEFGDPFQCPYCYMEQTVKNKAAWKKHVFRDLKSYVCTFRECNLKMFRSRNEWFAHEIQNHRREWVCIFCLDSFTDKQKFSEHLRSMHSSVVGGSQLEALVLQCEEPVDKIPASSCLLCDEWESNLLDPKQDSKRLFLNDGEIVEPCGTLVQFRRHLGRHMQQLALFALPMAEEDEMEDDSVKEASDDDDDLIDDRDIAVDPKDDELLVEDSDLDIYLSGYLLSAILERVQELKCDNLNDLVGLIFDEFRSDCYPGEEVTVIQYPGPVGVIGTVKTRKIDAHVLSDGSLGEPFPHYTIKLHQTPYEEVSVDKKRIEKIHRVFTKQKLWSFIHKNVSREDSEGHPWVVKPEAAIRYSVLPELTPVKACDLVEAHQGDEKIDSYSSEFYYKLIDNAVGRGPLSVHALVENIPQLLANIRSYDYLVKAIAKQKPSLSDSSRGQMYQHVSEVLSFTVVIKSLPVTLKKSQFLEIMEVVHLTAPKTLTFQYDSDIFQGRAFARFATLEEAQQAIDALNGFEIQGRMLSVDFIDTAFLGDAPSDGAGGSDQTIYPPGETGDEEVTTSEASTSKATILSTLLNREGYSIDLINLDNFDKIAMSNKHTLVAFFLSHGVVARKLFASMYEQLAQEFAFAKDKIVIAKAADADAEEALAKRLNLGISLPPAKLISHLPTIMYFDGKSNTPEEYEGRQDLESLREFLTKKTGIKPTNSFEQIPAAPDSPTAAGEVPSQPVVGNPNVPAVPTPAEPFTIDPLPSLSERAIELIIGNVVRPLEIPEFLFSRFVVVSCMKKMVEKELLCLRDVEQYLISEVDKSNPSYHDFCVKVYERIQETVFFLGPDELARPHDLPYSKAYFYNVLEQAKQQIQPTQESVDEEGKAEAEYSIFVSGLGPDVNEYLLASLFQVRYSSCKSAQIMSRDCGFVRFTDKSDHQRALIEMQGVYCGKSSLRISDITRKNKFGGVGPAGVPMDNTEPTSTIKLEPDREDAEDPTPEQHTEEARVERPRRAWMGAGSAPSPRGNSSNEQSLPGASQYDVADRHLRANCPYTSIDENGEWKGEDYCNNNHGDGFLNAALAMHMKKKHPHRLLDTEIDFLNETTTETGAERPPTTKKEKDGVFSNLFFGSSKKKTPVRIEDIPSMTLFRAHAPTSSYTKVRQQTQIPNERRAEDDTLSDEQRTDRPPRARPQSDYAAEPRGKLVASSTEQHAPMDYELALTTDRDGRTQYRERSHSLQRGSSDGPSVSDDTGRGNESVRIEVPNSHRQRSSFYEPLPVSTAANEDKLDKAATYQDDVAGPNVPLTQSP